MRSGFLLVTVRRSRVRWQPALLTEAIGHERHIQFVELVETFLIPAGVKSMSTIGRVHFVTLYLYVDWINYWHFLSLGLVGFFAMMTLSVNIT